MHTFRKAPMLRQKTTLAGAEASHRVFVHQQRELCATAHSLRDVGNETALGSPNISKKHDATHERSHYDDFSLIPPTSNSPVALQAKLSVGAPRDTYEEEAERVAERVMRMPEPGQKNSWRGGSKQPTLEKSQGAQDPLSTKVADAQPEGTRRQSVVFQVLKSSGQTLDDVTRDFFEARLGGDFSGVRVHEDERAAEASRSINAEGFTVGQDIVFARGRYSPASVVGRKLLAHELVHVMQQNNQRSHLGISPVVTQQLASRRVQRQQDVLPAEGRGREGRDDDKVKYQCLSDLMDANYLHYDEIAEQYKDANASRYTQESMQKSLAEHLGASLTASCNCCGMIIAVTVTDGTNELLDALPGYHKPGYDPDPDPAIQSLGERVIKVADGGYTIQMFAKIQWGVSAACCG